MTGTDLPSLVTAVPGPRSRSRVDVLARHECPAITARRARRAVALGAGDDDPIVWDEAVGANVRDVDGNVYVDTTAGFGVAFVGHRDPAVVAAVTAQSHRLVHAMGDAFPDDSRIRLLAALARVAPAGLETSILGLSGSDAVEAAVKTALLATGRRGVLAFEGGYHGLSLGAVGLQGYRPDFTDPFRAITHPDVRHLPYGAPMAAVRAALGGVGLVMVEPLQGRGGMRAPPDGWLAELAATARAAGALVAFDEIYAGLGRTGAWWAAGDVVPDLLCVGKALGGGFPISACLGTRAVMDAWGASTGEALHTQTFLGHPIGCAAASAVLERLAGGPVPDDGPVPVGPLIVRARTSGDAFAARLTAQGLRVRGRGLMRAVETGPKPLSGLRACRMLLHRGFLALPAGARAEAVAYTPPACLTDAQGLAFEAALVAVAAEVA